MVVRLPHAQQRAANVAGLQCGDTFATVPDCLIWALLVVVDLWASSCAANACKALGDVEAMESGGVDGGLGEAQVLRGWHGLQPRRGRAAGGAAHSTGVLHPRSVRVKTSKRARKRC